MEKARPLTIEQYRDDLFPVFNRIFETHIINIPVVLPVFSNRTILSPITFTLGEDELYALSNAIREIGENGFYLSLLERFQDPNQINDWWIPLDDIKIYGDGTLHSAWGVLENAFYSPSGQWGIVCNQDSFAVVGGTDKFLKAFFNHSKRSAKDHLKDYFDNLRYERDEHGHYFDLLPKLISTIFGPEKAGKLLAENDLP